MLKLGFLRKNPSITFRNNLYMKLLLSFIVLNILNIFVVFGLFYYQSDKIMKRDIDMLSHKLLSQSQNVSNYFYTSTMKAGFDLYQEAKVYAAMYSSDPIDVYDQEEVYRRMKRTIQLNPIIQSIYLYNINQDVVLSTVFPNGKLADFPDKEMTAMIQNFTYDTPQIPYILRNTNNGRTLSLIISEPSSNSGNVQGALIMNIDSAKLKAFMDNMASDPLNQLIIIQKDGTFVTSPRSALFMDEDSKFRFMSRINESGQNAGTFMETIDGKTNTFAYQLTDVSSTGFIYISVYLFSELFENLIRIRYITLVTSISLIAVSLLASILLSRNIYFPIRSLKQFAMKKIQGKAQPTVEGDIDYISHVLTNVIHENESLEQFSNRTKKRLREQFLRSLLLGHENSHKTLEESVQEHQVPLGSTEPVRVIVVRMDHYRQFEALNDAESRQLIMYAMRNITEETIAMVYTCIAVDISADHCAVMIEQTNEDEALLSHTLRTVQHNIDKYLTHSVTIGIGELAETLSDAAYSYDSAYSSSHYRIYAGPGSLLKRGQQSNHGLPAEREKAIMDAVKLSKPQRVQLAVDSLLESLSTVECRDILEVIAPVILNVMKMIRSLPSSPDVLPWLSYGSIYDKLLTMEEKDEIRVWMVALFTDAMQEKGEEKRTKINDTVEKAIVYIDEHYMEVEFSVADVAERLQYSVSYLNKLLKEKTTVSVHEYINRKRLLKAKELIECSDMLIHDIAAVAGFSSSNYFYYVFKKEYGVTPNAYRKMQHNPS